MIIKREFILSEDDIKEAIKDYLYYEVEEVEDKDKISIVLKAKLKTDNERITGYEIIAICKEDTGNAEQA